MLWRNPVLRQTKELPEYETVRNMPGVGNILACKLIAEIGDVRRFHNASALIAYAGIDAPPYQQGNFRELTEKYPKEDQRCCVRSDTKL